MKHITIPFFAIGLLIFIGISFSETNAQLAPNQANLVEGSGFAVTDQSIKISQIDLLMSTGSQTGSSIRTVVEDGFVTMDEIDFAVEDITGSILRDGRFIRLVGTAESSIGSQVTISLFGKLVQNTDEGSIYSFSGKLTQGAESNKIIYTTKISTLGGTISSSSTTSTTGSQQNQQNIIEVRIAQGSANPTDFSYLSQGYILQKELLSPNRISTTPGVTLTFVNEDLVSHNISSGHRDTGSGRGAAPNIVDGRFTTGEIPPGESRSITINDLGFYSLFDADYPWMTMDVVVFPDVESDILRRSSTNPLN